MSDDLRNRKSNNELPDVEVLGEWDHGMCDPIFDENDEKDTTPSMGSNTINMNNSCRKLMDSVVNAEHVVEGVLRSAVHKMDDAVERLSHRTSAGASGNDAEEESEKNE